jgi:alpha-mannosidase
MQSSPDWLREARPLQVEVFQTPDRLPFAEAIRAEYRPVDPGFRWGPVWSTAWFRLRGQVPASCEGRPLALRFSSGTEALLWEEGQPRQGFDRNHHYCVLRQSAQGGEELELYVEAACNTALGQSMFWWDPEDLQQQWSRQDPGELRFAEIGHFDEALWRAHVLAEHRQAMEEHPLEGRPTRCFATGHAHIDTAWLWPLAETRRKIVRSWATALELMERYPDYRFIASQAQQYAFLQEDAPELLRRIQRRTAEGRWEAGGAMWIEADCQVPSGESLIRQFVHGKRSFSELFGEQAPQRHLFLPDSFGFPASLPQIARLAGVDTFITNKISWCDTNEFPHVSFRWRGIDGTELLTHFTPGDNYNASFEAKDVQHGAHKLSRLAPASQHDWLFLFGFGDGGGGPTPEMLERMLHTSELTGALDVRPSTVRDFCTALHEKSADLPVWDDELYLELHRGTFTSQAWLKEANACAERRLREIEIQLVSQPDLSMAREHAATLDAAWKHVLLHQFHDILPGTSIREVYDDARASYAAMSAQLDTVEEALQSAAASAGAARVFNPASSTRSGVIEHEGELSFCAELAPLDSRPLEADTAESVQSKPRQLFNHWLRVQIDDAGRISSLHRYLKDTPINASMPSGLSPLNQLVIYQDQPKRWEAWDIDADYQDSAEPIEEAAESIRVAKEHPLRGEIVVERPIGERSHLKQRYRLDAASERLDIELEIDWQEEQKLLRALFPTCIRARHACYGIQFGHLWRATHRNTSWEQARFEVPGHGFVDLSEPGLGLALLDFAKFGKSCVEGTLGLSLLRAPLFPDPSCDRGQHRIRYALLPHSGEAELDSILSESDALAHPLRVTRGQASEQPPFVLDAKGHVEIAAFKLSEDGRSRILRLVERSGSRGPIAIHWMLPVQRVGLVDLHEQGLGESLQLNKNKTRLELRPFEIVTLRID